MAYFCLRRLLTFQSYKTFLYIKTFFNLKRYNLVKFDTQKLQQLMIALDSRMIKAKEHHLNTI